jgi:hypothetical protein
LPTRCSLSILPSCSLFLDAAKSADSNRKRHDAISIAPLLAQHYLD